MITQQRIDNFQGSPSEYITYLENKVRQLSRVFSPPSPESDTIFIQCDSESFARPAKRPRITKYRWQTEMDGMLGDIPSAKEWLSKRTAIGLSSLTEILDAFDIIIGGAMPSATPAVSDSSIVRFEPADAVMRLLDRYASAVAVLDIRKRFTKQIVHFCKLVFVSLCCVLVYQGVNTDQVDGVMRICVGPLDAKYLDVLRRGARWANRMISALATKGLFYRGSEAFVICGRSISHYGRFGDAGDTGFEYFLERLSVDGFDSSEPGPHPHLPFWIPYFIKAIVGDIYSLSSICEALGYGKELPVDGYPLWLEIYHKRELPEGTEVTDSSECRDRPRQAEVALSDLNSLDVLLSAAEQSGPLSPPCRTSSDSSVLGTSGIDQAPSQAQATEGLLTGERMMHDQEFDLLLDPTEWELLWDEGGMSSGAI